MNLDELRSVQNRERQTDSLQHLRESFYEEVGTYISDLKTERERAAERADDPWSDPEIQRLTDEIETAEDVAESIYERRMGKLVKSASLAAGGYTTDSEGLTLEEERLFEDLVERIETNKETVLDVLAGEAVDPGDGATATSAEGAEGGPSPATSVESHEPAPEPPEPTPEPAGTEATDHAAEGVDAASMMTGGDNSNGTTPGTDDPLVSDSAEGSPSADAVSGADNEIPPEVPPDDGSPADTRGQTSERPPGGDEATPRSEGTDPPTEHSGGESTHADGNVESVDSTSATAPDPETAQQGLDSRKTVRITSDIGQILGVDEHEYDLAAEDVVTLPAENAGPLIEQDAAEPIE